MKILIVSATVFEIQPLITFFEKSFKKISQNEYRQQHKYFKISVTGVGLTSTAYQLTKAINKEGFDLILNFGIAGAINRDLELGEVTEVVSECFGDLGAEDKDGGFLNLFALQLLEENQFPYQDSLLMNPYQLTHTELRKTAGQSVNKVNGSQTSIERLRQDSKADIEDMESAAIFQICLTEGVRFAVFRSISNYVEPRDKSKWKMKLAIENLNKFAISLVSNLKESN